MDLNEEIGRWQCSKEVESVVGKVGSMSCDYWILAMNTY
jgi:hypothetical protein